jgi:hypothetical protein
MDNRKWKMENRKWKMEICPNHKDRAWRIANKLPTSIRVCNAVRDWRQPKLVPQRR